MNVLIVGLSGQIGGIETLFHSIIGKKLDSIHFSIICFEEKCAYEDEYEQLGYIVYHLPSRKDALLKFDAIVVDFFKKHREYDYIWINTSSNSMYQFQVYGKKYTNAKIITHSHGTAAYKGRPTIKSVINGGLSIVNRNVVLKNTDYFFACSKAAGYALFGEKYKDSIIVINNGIDTEKFRFNFDNRKIIRKQLNIKDDTTVIGMIGRLSPQKNPVRGIELFSSYHRINPNSVMLVCGCGELEQAVRKKVDDCSLKERVFILGVRNDIPQILSAMDVLLMPSLFEGLPVVGVEAQCNGILCYFSSDITEEVGITDLAHFVALQKSDSEWADTIYRNSERHIERERYAGEMKKSGYDIDSTRELVKKVLNGDFIRC